AVSKLPVGLASLVAERQPGCGRLWSRCSLPPDLRRQDRHHQPGYGRISRAPAAGLSRRRLVLLDLVAGRKPLPLRGRQRPAFGGSPHGASATTTAAGRRTASGSPSSIAARYSSSILTAPGWRESRSPSAVVTSPATPAGHQTAGRSPSFSSSRQAQDRLRRG